MTHGGNREQDSGDEGEDRGKSFDPHPAPRQIMGPPSRSGERDLFCCGFLDSNPRVGCCLQSAYAILFQTALEQASNSWWRAHRQTVPVRFTLDRKSVV